MVVLPKRRKCKDNPYTLIYCEEKETYMLKFKDSKNMTQIIAISNQLYELFNKFELEDISMMHKVDKHIEHSELYDSTLNTKAINKPISVEEEVERNINYLELEKAINSLPNVQKRRIKMYYFNGVKMEDIAKIEKCSFQAISKSINLALQNLNKILKK